MKALFGCLLLALVLLMPGWLRAQTTNGAPADSVPQELQSLQNGLPAAINKGDIEATLAFLHTNCVITWPDAEVSRGRESVRVYYQRMMTGPAKFFDGFQCEVKLDEPAILSERAGVCFGSAEEHFKLPGGKALDLQGRWTATLVKEDGRWLVASLHCSTNVFDNPLLAIARKAAWMTGLFSLVFGLGLGWFVARRPKAKV